MSDGAEEMVYRSGAEVAKGRKAGDVDFFVGKIETRRRGGRGEGRGDAATRHLVRGEEKSSRRPVIAATGVMPEGPLRR